MKELAGRLSAYDPDIGDAVRIISYFDELQAHRGGLETIVRGIAVLAGAPARLSTAGRRKPLRVLPDGRREDSAAEPDDDWQSIQLADFGATLWLERSPFAGGIDPVILERAAIALRAVLDRTPPASRKGNDPALVEIILDPESNPGSRAQAARSLGIKPGQFVRAIAEPGQQLRLEVVVPGHDNSPAIIGTRAGIGPAVDVAEAPRSAREAAMALRFTTEATPTNPHGAVVYSETLGILTVLTTIADQDRDHQDIDGLRTFVTHGPHWLPETLDALSTTESLRAAARTLVIHHSTLHHRIGQVSKALGWDVTTPGGKLRLQVTLLLWRLAST